nr:MAG TPA: hypothetical protein [Bacteriophage sp.]
MNSLNRLHFNSVIKTIKYSIYRSLSACHSSFLRSIN